MKYKLDCGREYRLIRMIMRTIKVVITGLMQWALTVPMF